MNPLLWAAIRAFLACLILTPILRDVFRTYGLVDHPDRTRKMHAYPIPRVGGIPIMMAYAFALYQFVGEKTPLTEYAPMAWRLAPAVLLIFATGLIDDFFGLEPWQKLAGQLAAAGLACWAGVRVFGIAGYETTTWWSIPLTVGWLIVCTNAFNLVDGLDGLAAGMGLVAALTISAAALMAGNPPLAYASVPLAGALLGFLCYNLTPATIFLGDSGSLLIGFLLGCYGAVWSQKSATLIGITIPVLALSIPLLDIILAIVRRFLRNQPIFSADRGHIHHRLLERGLTPRRAVLVLYLVCALAAGFALVVALPYGVREGGRRYYGFAILALCAAAVLGIRQLRYAEFGLASRLLFGGEFQRTLGGQMQLERLAEEFGRAQTEGDCWRLIASAAREFGFDRAQLSLRGQRFEENFRDAGANECWSLVVPLDGPLGGADSLQLERPFESDVLPMMVARFLDTVRRGVQAKLQEWDEQPVA